MIAAKSDHMLRERRRRMLLSAPAIRELRRVRAAIPRVDPAGHSMNSAGQIKPRVNITSPSPLSPPISRPLQRDWSSRPPNATLKSTILVVYAWITSTLDITLSSKCAWTKLRLAARLFYILSSPAGPNGIFQRLPRSQCQPP